MPARNEEELPIDEEDAAEILRQAVDIVADVEIRAEGTFTPPPDPKPVPES